MPKKTFIPTPNNITVYRFIVSQIKENGYAPTVTEISVGTRLARSSVQVSLSALIEGGFINSSDRQWRGLTLTKKSLI